MKDINHIHHAHKLSLLSLGIAIGFADVYVVDARNLLPNKREQKSLFYIGHIVYGKYH